MSYKIGVAFERYLVRKFREQGLMAWRTPASQSPIDLIIYNPEDKTWLLVQVKKIRTGRFSLSRYKRELEQIKEWANKFFANDDRVSVEFWIWYLPERRWIKHKIK